METSATYTWIVVFVMAWTAVVRKKNHSSRVCGHHDTMIIPIQPCVQRIGHFHMKEQKGSGMTVCPVGVVSHIHTLAV